MGDEWVEEATLEPNDQAFGWGVGLSSPTAAVATCRCLTWRDACNLTDRVHIFELGARWETSAVLELPQSDRCPRFALQGSTLVVDRDPGLLVYERGDDWHHSATLELEQVRRGWAIALDGHTLVSSADDDSVYVFERWDGIWELSATLAPDIPVEDFGRDVAVSGDTLLVGSSSDAVFVFERSAGIWSQSAILSPSDAAEERSILTGKHEGFSWGHPIALDGDTAIVGAYRSDWTQYRFAALGYVFTKTERGWEQAAKLERRLEFQDALNVVDVDSSWAYVGASRALLARLTH